MNRNPGSPFSITDIALTGLSVLFLALLLTVLHPCPALEDGTRMICYIAWTSLVITAVLDVLLSAVHFFLKDPAKKRLADLGIFVLSAVTFLIPGTVVPICGDISMQCRALMRPGALIFAVLLILCANMDMNSLQKRSG